jgi:hypothetical protein
VTRPQIGTLTQIAKKTSKRDRHELKVLTIAFPEARQILYASLWDDGDSEYASACVAVSLQIVPVFTSEIEVTFVRAFVNSFGVVAGQAKLSVAVKQKADFVSSISHVSCGANSLS